MRAIVKGREPCSLTEHRAKVYSDYDNFAAKDELRGSLVTEQRGLCCYCMCRISKDVMKVEHWRCRANYPENALNYSNLLGACRGGEDLPFDKQHCDTRKGDAELRWNPAVQDHAIESRIQYSGNGVISSSDQDFDEQLNSVLNLNLANLKNNRKSALGSILKWWRHRPRTRSQIRRKVEWLNGGHDSLRPFCQVAAWWLRKKL